MNLQGTIGYKDLREYLTAAAKLGELRRVDGADWDLEIGAITEVAARAARPKVLLFDNIKGYPKGFRVVTNAVCSAATTGLAFGLDPNSSQRYLKFFLRLIMVDRSDDVEGHTRTRERMAHGNVYALVRRPDRVCVSLFRPYRDQRLSVYAVAS